MASSVAMKLSFLLLLLLTLFSSMKTQARESQFFNKVSSSTTVSPNEEQPLNNNQQQEPNFLPENDNGYGLYGHESGKLPPSVTTAEPTTTSTSAVSKEPLHKYLPKNYNPVAYVTEPENVDDSNSFSEDTYTNNHENNNYNDAQNYYDNQGKQEYQTGEPQYRSYTANNRYSNNKFNYNGGSSFNRGPQRLSDTRFSGRENNFYNGDEESSFHPQGMSDTRSLEYGKYFYDVNNEKFSENHPYESFKGVRARNEYNDRNYNGNSYQNQYHEFPNEQNLP